ALRLALERLAEAAEASELIDEERYALTQLVRLAPDEPRYLERLNLLGGLQEETPEDLSALPAPEPTGDVPEFETFAVVEDPGDRDVPVPPPSLSSSSAQGFEVTEFETNEAAGFVMESGLETPSAAFSDPTASFADLNEEFETTSHRV